MTAILAAFVPQGFMLWVAGCNLCSSHYSFCRFMLPHRFVALLAASDLFMVAVASGSNNSAGDQADTLVGYTCGTLTTADVLTHESMSRHDPEAQTLCIHSVSVAAEHQRKGIARRMLKAYLQYVQQTSPQIESVQLICKKVLIPLYLSAGFTLVGPSPVVHGQDQWLEMRVDIH